MCKLGVWRRRGADDARTPVAVGADDPPPYASATEAYRQGVSEVNAGKTAVALPALEYAAKRGVLGAELKLARIYSSGAGGVAEDDVKAFSYLQAIADQYADISPSNPVAQYVGEAFVALGHYYLDGIHGDPAAANPSMPPICSGTPQAISAMLTRNTAWRGSILTARASERMRPCSQLARHGRKEATSVTAQATLGEMLWRGNDVRQREATGLALITLAHENAKASGKEPKWIGGPLRRG